MSIKDLFNKKAVVFDNAASASAKAESSANISSSVEEMQTYLPVIDFSTASNFVKYGSAELYYENSIKRIYQQYPYDGSLAERNLFQLSSSALDRWVYNYKYPKTTGYIKLGENFGSSVGTIGSYGGYQNLEYIHIQGGMHTASAGMEGKPLVDTFDDSVVFHTASNRTTSLKTNLVSGSTVEFWLRKPDIKSSGQNEVIFDLWNGELSSSADYGRMTIEYRTDSSPGKRFMVTLHSGSNGFTRELIGAAIPVGSDDWTHYAISFITEGNNVRTRLYTNGEETSNDALAAGVSLGEFSGKINANLGALLANPHGNVYHNSSFPQKYQGWGRLTGSLDEFKFWKVRRTSEEIKDNYFHPIGGGQNKKHPDEQLRNLGIYYKFNEGIVNTDSIDSTVLDYSGRIANGTWVGYPGSASRNTGSAMVSASVLTEEPHDPIIYSSHPEVTTLLSEMKASGSLHDRLSGSFLYDTIPSWIREEDTTSNIKSLFQVMSSYFDTLYSQITDLNKLQDKKYFNIDNEKFEVRPSQFAKRLLEGKGLLVPELFPNASVLEYFMQRDINNIKYDHSINDIKNLIYQNIYNNLENIYKSKGTHESYRNLLRCFGVDDEIVKLNMYTDQGIHYFRDNTRHTSVKKKYLNFNSLNTLESTVYQTSSALAGNTFISGSKTDYLEKYSAFTYEVDLIVPFKIKRGQRGYFSTGFFSSSIFGQHTAVDDPADYTWKSPDSSEFKVYLIRDELESSRAYFMLTSSVLGVKLTSSYYDKIYDNERWNLAVRLKPANFPLDGGIHSSSAPSYQIEFYGVNHTTDIVANEFHLSASVSNTLGQNFISSHKRIYVGAHRTNFTGALLQESDIQVGSTRVWMDDLDNATIKNHSLDPFNYGASKGANSNSTMFTVDLSGSHIPKYDSLALHWQLDTLTSSNGSGFLEIDDFSSGSSDNLYGWVDNIINEKHPGKGEFFPNSSTAVVSNEYVFASRKQLPEVSVSYDRVFIKGDEEKYFIEDDDVSDNFYSLEKSFYGNISEEILDTFSTVAEMSNLMGKYQDRYKKKYSRLEYFKRIFFERVDGDLDFDQFTSYFKWIDSSISTIVRQLVPISARISPDVSNMVESHILERNKYENKFPLLERESQDPKFGNIKSIGEMTYNWKFGHAPLGIDDEKAMCVNIDNLNSSSGNQQEVLITPTVNLKDINPTVDEFTSKDITFSFWLNPNSSRTGQQVIFSLFDTSLTNNYRISIELTNSRFLVFRNRYAGSSVTWVSDFNLQSLMDTWSHITITYNGAATNSGQSTGTVNFHLNGAAPAVSGIGTYQPPGPPEAQKGNLWVVGGVKNLPNSDLSFSGKIDDLAIWETVLTPSEVSTLYNSGQTYNLSTIQPSNIVAWWRMGDHPDDITSPFTVNNEIKPDQPLQQPGSAGGITFDPNTYSTSSLNFVNTSDRTNCLWWDERALRESDVSINNATLDEQRESIRKISTYNITSSSPQFSKTDKTIYSGSAYAIRRFSKPYRIKMDRQPVLHAGTNYDTRKNRDIVHSAVHIHGPFSPQTGVPMNIVLVGAEENDGLVKEIPCNDIINPDLDSTGDSIIMRKKRRNSDIVIGREFEDEKFTYDRKLTGDMVLPFSIYSSSTENMKGVYENLRTSYANDIIITNVHSDTYGNKNDLGLQGPFSDTWVGGHQHRHVDLNKYDTSLITFEVDPNNPSSITSLDKDSGNALWTGLRDIHNRPEAWYIYHESAGILEDPLGTPEPDGIIGVVGPDYGFGYPSQVMFYAHRYRDERAKRPVNIKNIKSIRPQTAGPVAAFTEQVEVETSIDLETDTNIYINTNNFQARGLSINNLVIGSTVVQVGGDGSIGSGIVTIVTANPDSGLITVNKANTSVGSAKLILTFNATRPDAIATSTSGIHRQFYPYFHSGSDTNQLMTGSAKLGNFYSNYEVVQTSGRSTNNLFFRKAFGSGDIDGQESPILPEAMRSKTSEIYSGSVILANATHYSALYGRRPTLIHNDGNLFLREPKYVGVGSTSDTNYCVDFVTPVDSGVTVRNFFESHNLIVGPSALNNLCFSMWYSIQDNALSAGEYTILAQFGQPTSFATGAYSYEIHLIYKSAGEYDIRVVIGGTVSPGVYESLKFDSKTWNHLVFEFVQANSNNSIPIRIFANGEEITMNKRVPLDGWVAPYKDTVRLCLSSNTSLVDGNGDPNRIDMSFTNAGTLAKFHGYMSDCFVLAHEASSTGLPDALLKRFYNRGFLCDPTLLTDREILFWFGMGRHPDDTLTQNGQVKATFNPVTQRMDTGILLNNLIDKTNNHSKIIIDDQQKPVQKPNHFATPDAVPAGKPPIPDTSGFVWEYAFDKNPSLSGSNSNSVFVNRFSSPGGPEVMSRGFLDAASGEYSVYNCLPWRNLSVKGTKPRAREDAFLGNPYIKSVGPFNGTNATQAGIHVLDQHGEFDGLYARLSRHSGRYGVDSKKFKDIEIVGANSTQFETRVQSPSYHKQQRNIARRPQPSLRSPNGTLTIASTLETPVLKESFDNAYVNTPIPRSDFQYTWVTASLGQDYAVGSGQQNFYGYAPRDGEFKSSTEVTVNGTYHSISDFGINTGYYIGVTNLARFYSGNWSFAAWIKPRITNSFLLAGDLYLYTLYLNDQNGTSYYVEVYIDYHSTTHARLWLKVPNESGTYGEWYYDLDIGIYDDQWLHLVISFDESDVSCPAMIFINGVEVEEQTQVAFTGTMMKTRQADRLYIYSYDGLSQSSSDKNFIGSVDETVIFNKTLKKSDVETIYNSGKAYNYNKKFAISGLIAWWRFGDSRDFQGDIYSSIDSHRNEEYVFDRSGFNYHLEVENKFSKISTESSSPFNEKKISYIKVVEAITFPSASKIVGV